MSTIVNGTGTADLHMHTRYSDGAPTVDALLRHVVTCTNLDVIAITDHDTIVGAVEARELARREGYAVEVVVGEEVSTRDGHLVGLFLSERVAPGMSAADTVAAIHAQGGLAFAPHPYLRFRQKEDRPITMVGLGDTIRDLALDAIETINATPFLSRPNRRAAAYNRTRHLPALGNSDGHIPAAVGKGYTLFPGKTALALRAAIEAGRTAACARAYRPNELLTYLDFWLHQQGFLPQAGDGQRATGDSRARNVVEGRTALVENQTRNVVENEAGELEEQEVRVLVAS